MAKTTPLSPAMGRRDDTTGGQLLKELEALSQALYRTGSGSNHGRSSSKETPSSPYLGSVSGPRGLEPVSPYFGGIAAQPPSPYLGSRRDSRSEEPQSPSLGSYGRSLSKPQSPHLGGRRGGPPSPYLGGLVGSSRNEPPRTPVIVSLSGGSSSGSEEPRSPYLGGRAGGRRGDGDGRPPLIEPKTPYLGAMRNSETKSPYLSTQRSEDAHHVVGRRGEGSISPYLGARRGEAPSSPYLGARRSEEAPPSPYLEGRRSEEIGTPRLGGRRGDAPIPWSPRSRLSEGILNLGYPMEEVQSRYLSRIEESGNGYERDAQLENLSKSPYQLSRPELTVSPRGVSDSYKAGGITHLALSSAATILRSHHKRPPIPSRVLSSSLPGSSYESERKAATYRLDIDGDSLEPPVQERSLQPWHSQGFEKNLAEVTNFPAWLEDNLQFSKKLEAPKEKKSLWKWKPFRVFSHIGQQKYNCMFIVHVHGIENLPAAMSGLRLSVQWKRKDSEAQTSPSRVYQGLAEFEETLKLKSTVYGSRSESHGMKYMAKNFDLAVVALDVDELVLGKHRLDLSRLLPNTTEDKSDDESDHSWTTSFKLTGKAKGGTLIVTFGFQLLNKDSQPVSSLSSARFSDSPMSRPLRSFTSMPSSPQAVTLGGRASNFEMSPAMSEMPVDGEYMRMEHLSLDEFSLNDGPISARKSNQKGQTRPSFNPSPEIQKRLSFGQSAANQGRAPILPIAFHEDTDYFNTDSSYDDEGAYADFTVVHQGHETSAISDLVAPVDYDDPIAEEDTVEGLSDTQEEEDSIEDPEVLRAQVGVDVVIESEAAVQADDVHSGKTLQKSSAEAVANEFDQITAEQILDDVKPMSDHKMEQHETKAQPEEQEQEQEESEEGFVEAQDPLSSEAIVKNSEEILSSVPVGLPIGTAQGHPIICREGYIANDKEDEKEINVVLEEFKVKEEQMSNVVVQSSILHKDSNHNDKDAIVDDDDLDIVAGEFLSLLGDEEASLEDDSESGEDSPRALRLQQFEQEALIECGLDLNFLLPESAKFTMQGMQDKPTVEAGGKTIQEQTLHTEDFANEGWGSEGDTEMASIMEIAEAELQKATQAMRSRIRAKLLEDEETKALMEEWGLDDEVFVDNPLQLALVPYDSSTVPMNLAPSLGKEIVPVMRIRDGKSHRPKGLVHLGGTGLLTM